MEIDESIKRRFGISFAAQPVLTRRRAVVTSIGAAPHRASVNVLQERVAPNEADSGIKLYVNRPIAADF
jgi:hypothetical protein